MIITHSLSHTQASVCQRSALASVKTASDPFHGTNGAAREALGRWGGRRPGDVLHFWRTNWLMNSFCSDSTLRRASYSMRYLKRTQRRSHPTIRGRVWRPISHANSVYRSCCSFFSAIRVWSCCCWASRCFATVFSRFRAPIAWMEMKENGELFSNISNKPHEPPKSQQLVKKKSCMECWMGSQKSNNMFEKSLYFVSATGTWWPLQAVFIPSSFPSPPLWSSHPSPQLDPPLFSDTG